MDSTAVRDNPLRNRPIQVLHSFEGLINEHDGVDGSVKYRRGWTYTLERFDERVRAELEKLVARGVGGICVNVSYDGYLEDDECWRRFVRGVELAVECGLRIWIYDERGYPSGSAGGLVARNHPEFEAIGIKKMQLGRTTGPCRIPLPHPRATLFAAFAPSPEGRSERLDVPAGASELALPAGRYESVEVYFMAPCFEGSHADYKETSREPYMNPLDRDAVNRFLSVTHLEYYRRLPPHLWRHVEAFFTDEPSLMAHTLRPQPGAIFYPSVPWSKRLSSAFYERQGYFIEDHVQSLFGGGTAEDRKHRSDFWAVVAEEYEEALGMQTSDLCAALNVASSGHLLAEETLWQHAVIHANLIGLLQHYQIPGIDILTCEPGYVNRTYPLTIKTGLSAAVLGGKRDLMVEVSEYCEYWTPDRIKRLQTDGDFWTGPRNANPLEYIKYTLAYCFLAGVRDFGMYFIWRAYSEAEYRELCNFVERLNNLGRGPGYKPTCALYYPIETMWEEYIPSEKDVWTGALEGQSERCRTLNRVLSDTCKSLLLSNIQFIFVDRRHLPQLKDLGVKTLLYPLGEQPSRQARDLCRRMGVELCELSTSDASGLTEPQRSALSHPAIRAGENVIFHSYDGFAFILNTGKQPSSFAVTGTAEAAFPLREGGRQKVSGRVPLDALECAFLFTAPA